MPPKPKFTREEITAAALRVISRNGITALTAQALGQELGSSSRPVFTVFKTMEEVRQEVDPVAYCGFSCNHCFLGQWCGGCKSVLPCCSFGTLYEKGKCLQGPGNLCKKARERAVPHGS